MNNYFVNRSQSFKIFTNIPKEVLCISTLLLNKHLEDKINKLFVFSQQIEEKINKHTYNEEKCPRIYIFLLLTVFVFVKKGRIGWFLKLFRSSCFHILSKVQNFTFQTINFQIFFHRVRKLYRVRFRLSKVSADIFQKVLVNIIYH